MKPKLVALLIILCMLLSQISVFAASAPSWPASRTDGRSMPFRPDDKYVSVQNPPGFSWNSVSGAKSYIIRVATDNQMKNVVYCKQGITANYYNFPFTFNTGINYWWTVSYVNSSGVESVQTTPRRFIIDSNAFEFPVPDMNELVSRIPERHPKLYVNDNTLESFRNLKNISKGSQVTYDNYIKAAETYLAGYAAYEKDPANGDYRYSLEEPEFTSGTDLQQYRQKVVRPAEFASKLSFAYVLTGEEKYALQAAKILTAISTWCMKKDENGDIIYDENGNFAYDPNGHSSYANQDQAHRELAYVSAMAYDWIADTLSETDRKTILNMIRERTYYMAETKRLMYNIPIAPYDSHAWTAMGFIGIICIATYDEIPESAQWLNTVLPLFLAICPPWSYQDGGWSQGTDYWQYSSIHGQDFYDVLAHSGIINIYDMAWLRNEYLWNLYVYPKGSYGSFGDDSNRRKSEDGSYSYTSLQNRVYFTQDPTTKWLYDQYGKTVTNTPAAYINNNNSHIGAEAPVDFPLGHEFKDIGWATMTTSHEDTTRLQLVFKSSHYGSYNHSHADQNSFIIQAYGEHLANKSGYYSSYHDVHDCTITRASFAHNTITVDGGKGQLDDSFNAKGDLLQFVTQMDFDSVTGDATAAYCYTSGGMTANNKTPDSGKGRLDKFVRDIIYVRPGVFVVIDDLKAYNSAAGGKSSFEWWLNAEHEIEYSDNYALINENHAHLKADVIYPENTVATYYDGFISPIDNAYYPAEGRYADYNEQSRVKFATDKVSETKMVVTMSVYGDGEEAVPLDTYYSPDGSYVKITFDDGAVCLVNLGEDNAEVSDGVYTFRGDALTYNDDSILLTNGVYAEYDGKVIVDSARSLTVAIGHNQLSISTMDDSDNYIENRLIIGNNNKFITVADTSDIKDRYGRVVSSETGLPHTEVSEDAITFYPYKDNYILLLNDADITLKSPDIQITDTSEDSITVNWKEDEKYTYDIIINNTIFENVSAPYNVNINKDEELYYIAVRSVSGSACGPWSDFAYYSPSFSEVYSLVKYTQRGSQITATSYVMNEDVGKQDYRMVVYGEDGNVKSILPMIKKGHVYSSTAEVTPNDIVKVMLWTKDGYVPITSAATFGENDTRLRKIVVGGKALPDFSMDKHEYSVTLPYMTPLFPSVKAYPWDNTSKVTVSHDYSNLRSIIRVTAPDGETSETVVKYVLEADDIHLVKGASEEGAFTADTGRKDADGTYSGKRSNAKVVKLTYDIQHKAKYKDENGTVITPSENTISSMETDLYLYTNVQGYRGGSNFGSRTCSDREPNAGNHMEFYRVAESLAGYDYIVLPNVNYYSFGDTYGKDPTNPANNKTYAGGKLLNSKVSFTLDGPAEVVVVSAGEISSLVENNGFNVETLQTPSASRYMNTVTIEDIFYNEYFLGKKAEDYYTGASGARDSDGNITKALYTVNYDKTNDLVNVKPLSGYTTYKQYRDAADAGKITQASFTQDTSKNVCIVDGAGFVFNKAYTKVYDDVSKEGLDVTLDLGSYSSSAARTVIIIRPVTPKRPIQNFVYEGPINYTDIPSKYREGSTDNHSKRATLLSYANTEAEFVTLGTTFEKGVRMYTANAYYLANVINPQLDLDGAYYVPAQRRTESSVNNQEYQWARAYFLGLREYPEYYQYPNYPTEPQPWFSFDLNQSSMLYLVNNGTKPKFIDDTWQKLTIDGIVLEIEDINGVPAESFKDVYVKQVNVENGSSVKITMKTPATGVHSDGSYFLFIKPLETDK